MKRLQIYLLITILSAPPTFVVAQTTPDSTDMVENSKPTKEEKKAAREAKRIEKELEKSARKFEEMQQNQRNLASIKENIDDTLYVLEAKYLYDRYGRSYAASPALNFIAVARDTLILQIGSEFGLGPNGVGGITLQGRVTSYEVTESHGQGNLSVLMNVQSPVLGLATITVRVTQTGSFRASVSGSWRQQIQMSGNFRTWPDSKIFQGRATRSIYGPY